MSNNALIRFAKYGDLKYIANIESNVQSNPWNETQFQDDYNKKGTIFFVAIINNRVSGFLLAHKLLDEVELLKIAVSQNLQKKGIGLKLIKNLIEMSNQYLFKAIFLEVSSKNSSAIILYSKLNFKKIGVRKSYYGKNNDAIVMKMKVKE